MAYCVGVVLKHTCKLIYSGPRWAVWEQEEGGGGGGRGGGGVLSSKTQKKVRKAMTHIEIE